MAKYSINNFYKLKRGDVIHLNQSDYSIYNDMVQNIKATPIGKYNEIEGVFLDTLFVGIVRSITKSETESGKILGILTLEDASGKFSINLWEEDVHQIYKLDLDVPITIVLNLCNDSPHKAPAYRFIRAMELSGS